MMDRDEQQRADRMTARHFMDLSARAAEGSYVTFTGFLDMHEASILLKQKASYPAPCRVYGGAADAERVMAAFVPMELSESDIDYPVKYLKLKASFKSEAGDFGHRDILGSLMGLGIKRSLLGDIVRDDTSGGWHIVCSEMIAELICEELFSVRRINVTVTEEDIPPDAIKRAYTEKRISVASLRLDAVLAGVCDMSRTAADNCITAGRVYVNSEEEVRKSASLKEGDVISVRGFGKFRLSVTDHVTRKNKTVINAYIYK